MKNTLVRFINVFLILLIILPLCAGCHGKRKSDVFEIPDEFDTSASYEITFWAKNDTNKTQTAIYQKAIADFEELYPNIRVNMRMYTDYGSIYNDVITNISTGTTPNVCITYPDHIATYLTGENVVIPLDNLFKNKKYGFGGSEVRFDSPEFDEIIPGFLHECYFRDHYYAIPYMRSTEACYVNKTYVEKLGFELPDVLTWDFVWKVADAATVKDEEGNYTVNGQKTMIPFIYKSTDNMMIQLLKQKNAPYSDETGNILLFNDTTTELLKEIASHVKKGAFSTFKISSYPANFLNAGQCIFAIDSTAGATWMGSDAPNCDISKDRIVDFDIEVMTIPQYDTDNPQMISQGPSVCVFNKSDPQEVLASWLFTQFLLSNDVQISYSETEGYVPVTSKAQNSEEYKDYLSRSGEDNELHYSVKIDAANILLAHSDDTFVTPVFNGSASLRDAAGETIESVTKSIRRKETVDDGYFEKLYSNITSFKHLDQIGMSDSPDQRKVLGDMPVMSIALLSSLGVIWCGIGIYLLINVIKNKKRQ
ncbi:MAG: extracellular solute-binding protein [Clostridia bacterium]|nr:extracellular solute-binding protein [Clostridia bacterium]